MTKERTKDSGEPSPTVWLCNVLVTKSSSETGSAYMRIAVLKRFSAPYASRR
jgi:hypothetical protein